MGSTHLTPMRIYNVIRLAIWAIITASLVGAASTKLTGWMLTTISFVLMSIVSFGVIIGASFYFHDGRLGLNRHSCLPYGKTKVAVMKILALLLVALVILFGFGIKLLLFTQDPETMLNPVEFGFLVLPAGTSVTSFSILYTIEWFILSKAEKREGGMELPKPASTG
jgi:hypothetical protein